MTVSLVALRLEVDEHFSAVTSLQYVAEKYVAYAKEKELVDVTNDLSLTLQSERIIIPEHFKEIPDLHRGNREFRELTVETYDQEMDTDEQSISVHETSPCEHNVSESNQTSPREHNVNELNDTGRNLVKSPLTIQYFSGNPSVEITRGIMHLYKDKFLTPLDPDVPRSQMICMFGVPAKYNCQDLQKYIAPARDTVQHIKIIRDSIPNQYMVLIKFKDQMSADMFYQEYEGKPYNMLESEFSHLVYVSKIESMTSAEGGYLPVSSLTELPTCPVCLERMDESVAGILTVICNHSFHNDCLVKWQDACCPVCRYGQTPEPELEQKCFECDSRESLWICLICGYIGCGRYQELHAYQHYQQTAHTFSMQLGNQRVWDYAGDNYVHRLIQSKGDGKLVAVDNGEGIMDNEKMDSLTLEYTYLLTNQLESQRLYFEEKIGIMEKDAYEKISLMEASLHQTVQDCKLLQKKFLESEKGKKVIEKKYESSIAKAAGLGRELRDEKQMNLCLRENQVMWQEKVGELQLQYKRLDDEKRSEIHELQSEVTDLMKHLEVQAAVTTASHEIKEDIQGGHVFLEQSSTSSTKGGARSKRRK